MAGDVEEAIISLVVQGAAEASQAANKVEVDLTSAERAGKRAEGASEDAEKAAKDAESAASSLATEAQNAISHLAHAAHLLTRLAKAAGAGDGAQAFGDAVGTGLSTATTVGRVASQFLGPELGVPIGLAAGAISAGYTYASDRRESEQKQQADAEKIADAVAKKIKAQPVDLTNILLEQAGVAKLGALNGQGRGVQ